MPPGRPSEYKPDTADRICAELAIGRPLSKICKDHDMPDLSTVYRWLRTYPQFSEAYARAREDQADTFADEIIEIADDSTGDAEIDENGRRRMDAEFVARSRLRVDARKWIAAKLKPKKFSDRAGEGTDTRVEVRISGGLIDTPDADI